MSDNDVFILIPLTIPAIWLIVVGTKLGSSLYRRLVFLRRDILISKNKDGSLSRISSSDIQKDLRAIHALIEGLDTKQIRLADKIDSTRNDLREYIDSRYRANQATFIENINKQQQEIEQLKVDYHTLSKKFEEFQDIFDIHTKT